MVEMKNSGIDWVGSIPKNWSVEKAKYNFKNTKYIPGVQSEKYERLSLTLKGVIPRSKEDADGLQPKDFDTYQLLRKNELVFKLIDLQNVSTSRVGLAHDTGLVSPAYIILHQTGRVSPSFAEKYFLMLWYREIFNALGDNGVRSSLNASDLLDIPLVFPELEEQNKIVDFLNEKCTEIDMLVTDIQEEIDTLEEYKRSRITEAVTNGLNKNVQKKKSKIEWLRDIPEHWKEVPFRYVLMERNEKNNPPKTNERLSLSIGLGVTTYEEKTTNLDRFKEDVSQYKLAHVGDLVMNSMNMIVGATGVSGYFGCVSPAYYTFYDMEYDHVIAKYCEYMFLSPLLMGELHKLGKGIMFIERGEGKVNTCRLKVSRYDLGHIMLPIPPINELRDIVEYLNNLVREIELILEKKREQLEILTEYKKSIIYEYITGKKEVPLS